MEGKHDIPSFVFLKTNTVFPQQSIVQIGKQAGLLLPVRLFTNDLSDIFYFLLFKVVMLQIKYIWKDPTHYYHSAVKYCLFFKWMEMKYFGFFSLLWIFRVACIQICMLSQVIYLSINYQTLRNIMQWNKPW